MNESVPDPLKVELIFRVTDVRNSKRVIEYTISDHSKSFEKNIIEFLRAISGDTVLSEYLENLQHVIHQPTSIITYERKETGK